MINFRPARIEDIEGLSLRPEYSREPGVKNGFRKDIVLGYPSYSLVTDSDEVLAVLSGGLIWPGVLRVYGLIGDKVTKYPVGVTKAAIQLMEGYRKMHGIHRIQVTVRDDFPQAKKWVSYLGFYFEGSLYGYGQDKSDYLMFARYF